MKLQGWMLLFLVGGLSAAPRALRAQQADEAALQVENLSPEEESR